MPRKRRGEKTLFGRPRQLFLTGLAILFPLFITVWFLQILFGLVHGISKPIILNLLRLLGLPFLEEPVFVAYGVPLLGIVTTVLVVLLVGSLTTNFLGRRIVAAFDRMMLRIPLIKGIYGGARQLLDAFNRKTTSFQRVVAVEYPRPGVYTIGFVTREQVLLSGEGKRAKPHSLIFLPTTPNPTSGWLAAVPEDEVVPLDISIEEGVKLIVSGGLVVPAGWGRT